MEKNIKIKIESEHMTISKAKYKALVNRFSDRVVKACMEGDYVIDAAVLDDLVISSVVNKKFGLLKGTNFELLKEILLLQICFYSLSDVNDLKVSKRHIDYYESHIESYESIIKDICEELESIVLPFTVCLTRPLAESILDLSKFQEAAKITINIAYKYIEEAIIESGDPSIMPFWVFHKDIIGNESDWEDRIYKWKLCFYVCNKFKKEGISKTKLVKHMETAKSLFLNMDDMPNSIHKLNKLLDKAEQLILSVKRGTFPI